MGFCPMQETGLAPIDRFCDINENSIIEQRGKNLILYVEV